MLNSVQIAGQIIRGPDLYDIPAKDGRSGSDRGKTHACEFQLRCLGSSRQRRTLFIPCRAYDELALQVKKYLGKKDWVLVQGMLTLKGWVSDRLFTRNGERARTRRVEITIDSADPIELPWRTWPGGPMRPRKDFVRIPADEYERFVAFQKQTSEWDVPDHRVRELLGGERQDQDPGGEDGAAEL